MAFRKNNYYRPNPDNFETIGSTNIGSHSTVSVQFSKSTGNFGAQLALARQGKDDLGNETVTVERSKWITEAEFEAIVANAEAIRGFFAMAKTKQEEVLVNKANAPTPAAKRVSLVAAQTDALVNLSQNLNLGFETLIKQGQQTNETMNLVAASLAKFIAS